MVAAAEHVSPLMEEARRRTRRRRIACASATALVLAAGAGVYLGFPGANGGLGSESVARGFHLIAAQGPVAHALMQVRWRGQPRSIDLATGQVRPAAVTREVWWDRKAGFVRVVERVDGQLRSDAVGRMCSHFRAHRGSKELLLCSPPPPFELSMYGLGGKPKKIGVGRVGGQPVTWLEYGSSGCRCFSRVATSRRTGMPLVYRSYQAGTLLGGFASTFMKDLPARRVTFAVPEGGAPNTCFPPCAEGSASIQQSGLRATRSALGRVPLWFGRSLLGHRLRAAQVGTSFMTTRSGARVLPARFVRFNYGFVWVKEFGATRPFWYRAGPKSDTGVLEKVGQLTLQRDGLLVIITRRSRAHRLNPRRALELARLLRPLSPR